jgi:dnd system-associated protein 4
MRRRVKRAADTDQLLKDLTEKGRPFATMAHAMIFAAALGYSESRRQAFMKAEEAIPWEVFARISTGPDFIDMLAGVDSDDTDILSDARADDRVEIFEEYANGGLHVIAERMAADDRLPLEVLLDLVLERESADQAKRDVDLGALAAEIIS